MSDVDMILETIPGVTSPKQGTIAITSGDFRDAYRKLHDVLGEIYERDIENLIGVVANNDEYARPDLDDLIGNHPVA